MTQLPWPTSWFTTVITSSVRPRGGPSRLVPIALSTTQANFILGRLVRTLTLS